MRITLPAKIKTILENVSQTTDAAIKSARDDLVHEKSDGSYGRLHARKRTKADMNNPFDKHVLGRKFSTKVDERSIRFFTGDEVKRWEI